MYYVLSLMFLVMASYFDIKKRIIPPQLTYSAMLLGLLLHLFDSFTSASIYPVLLSILTGILCFCFAYLFYKLGAWAGGDVKLFTALGFLIPQWNGLPFFPFIILIASIFAFIPVSFYLILKAMLFSKSFRKEFRKNILSWLRNSAIMAIILTIFLSLFNPIDFFRLIIFSIIFSSFLLAIRIARKELLVEKVKASELKEGMMFTHHVVRKGTHFQLIEAKLSDLTKPIKNLIVNAHLARGLTPDEIKILKKSSLNLFTIKKSLPFVPLMFLGLLLIKIGSILFIY